MKPIIAFDLEGVLIRRSAGRLAHNEWFRSVGKLTEKEIANIDNEKYFDHVFDIIERKTDLERKKPEDRKLMTKLARGLFQEIYLDQVKKLKGRIEIKETIDFAKHIKNKYTLALITTTPEQIVESILKVIKCEKLFGIVMGSPLEKPPEKGDLLKSFVRHYGKPKIYFCDRKQDVKACRDLGIKSALVTIDICDEAKADFRVKSKKEMEEVVNKHK